MSRRLLALGLVLALTACGGGGGGGTSVPSAPGGPVSNQSGSARITLNIPNPPSSTTQSRNPKFVSSGAQGATIAAGPHGGTLTTTTFDLTSPSICQTGAGGRACTLTVTMPPGNDDVNITLYLLAPVSGAIPNGAPILGVSNSSNVPIVSGQTAAIVAYVLPTISNVTSTTPGSIIVAADNITHTGSIVLNPVDYSNNPITAGANDPYSNPITVTLTETGGTGHTVLTLNGTPAGNSVTLTQSSQSVGVQYDGGGSPGYYATFTGSATGVSPRTFHLVPMYVTSSSPYFSNGTLNFTGAGETATINISEALGFDTYTATPQTVASCPNVANVSAVTGSGATASYTVTSLNAAATLAAGCYMIVQDSGLLASRNISVTNTLSGGTVAIGGIQEYSTPISGPNNIVTGTDGLLYVTGTNSPSTTVWTYSTNGSQGNYSNALPATPIASAFGPDANLWFVAGDGNMYRWSDAQNISNAVTTAITGATHFDGITEGPDGNMWASDGAGKVFALSPTVLGSAVATYSVTGAPQGIASSSYGYVWVLTNVTAGIYQIGQISPGSQSVSYYTPSMPGTSPSPGGIVSDSNGNEWVTDTANNALDEYVPVGNMWHTYAAPTGVTGPGPVTIGTDGNIYYSATTSNQIVQFNPNTLTATAFTIPTASALPKGLTAGPDGRIWFTESASPGKIGALTP